MKISSTALRAKRSCASGYRWFARRFKSPAEYQSVIDALVADGRVDDACWLLDRFGPIETVLVVDGIFLHRDELAGAWDVSVFLEVPFSETFARMAVRDGCPPDPEDEANRRYVEGQRIYLAQCDPPSRATLVIDNTDPQRPVVRARRDRVTPGR